MLEKEKLGERSDRKNDRTVRGVGGRNIHRRAVKSFG